MFRDRIFLVASFANIMAAAFPSRRLVNELSSCEHPPELAQSLREYHRPTPAGGRQNGVAVDKLSTRCEDGRHGASKRGGAAHIGGRGRRGIDLHDVERAGLECEIAGHGHLAGHPHWTPPALTTVEPTVPLPPSVAPLFTVVRLDDAIDPSTTSMPAWSSSRYRY